MQKLFPLTMLIKSCFGHAQKSEDVCLFSCFKENGQDGLHLAYGFDGLNWTALKNDSSPDLLNRTDITDQLKFSGGTWHGPVFKTTCALLSQIN